MLTRSKELSVEIREKAVETYKWAKINKLKDVQNIYWQLGKAMIQRWTQYDGKGWNMQSKMNLIYKHL